MNSKVFCLALILFAFTRVQSQNNTQYVDPMIGTGGHGHTFPGATVPFGMVQLSPDTRIDGSWDGCSGYHYSDSVIYGFSHTHLSGTGCSDYGDISLMPVVDDPTSSATFSHKREKAGTGFYAVHLDNGIDVELTSTARVGFHKYTFPAPGTAMIVLNLDHRDKLTGGKIRIVNDSTLEVYRRSKAWASDQVLYARIIFSKRFLRERSSQPGKDTIDHEGHFTFPVASCAHAGISSKKL